MRSAGEKRLAPLDIDWSASDDDLSAVVSRLTDSLGRKTDWTAEISARGMPRIRARAGTPVHELLDRTGLIHRGGRVYDPTLGRFLSPVSSDNQDKKTRQSRDVVRPPRRRTVSFDTPVARAMLRTDQRVRPSGGWVEHTRHQRALGISLFRGPARPPVALGAVVALRRLLATFAAN